MLNSSFSLLLSFVPEQKIKDYVHEHERNYGYFSVIPFFFPPESQSYLLLLRQIYETIILSSMANVIKLRKGLDINLKGKAAETYATVKEPGFYAIVPDDFPGVKPKVVVKEQEYVMKISGVKKLKLICSSDDSEMKKAHPEYQKDLPVKKGAVSIHLPAYSARFYQVVE